MNDEYYLMWLTRIEGIGLKKAELLLENFDSAREVWFAPERLLQTVEGLSAQNIGCIIRSRDERILYAQMDELEKKRIRFISRKNKEYPKLLKDIYDPPIGIYVMGLLPDENKITVSVIGSRRCTEYGRTAAYEISKDLAARGVVIVSGMAKGIDGVSHQGAVDANGQTVAVLGCGVDICYPAENRALREKILTHGCLVSEFPPQTEPLPAHFPLRNRIISGMGRALLVIEAAKKSGTLITVDQALEQGREVLAVPGLITGKFSEGTNDLIKNGAGIVTNYRDVFDALGIFKSENENEKSEEILLAPDEKLVYDCISRNPVSVDEIASTVNKDSKSINYLLLMLEIKGCIKKLAGNRYARS